MIGGVDKYFQIAPCFRDEDPRADRHSCEFYQIDCEMSFVEQDDVHAVAESYINNLISSISDKTIISPIERLPWLQNILSPMPKINEKFPKIPYTLSMNLFGSDKPDLRFDCHMVNVTETFRNCEASFIADAIKNGSVLKAMRLPKTLCTRKEIDAITEVAKLAGA
jgi:aspartyl-tRNA synthetase